MQLLILAIRPNRGRSVTGFLIGHYLMRFLCEEKSSLCLIFPGLFGLYLRTVHVGPSTIWVLSDAYTAKVEDRLVNEVFRLKIKLRIVYKENGNIEDWALFWRQNRKSIGNGDISVFAAGRGNVFASEGRTVIDGILDLQI